MKKLLLSSFVALALVGCGAAPDTTPTPVVDNSKTIVNTEKVPAIAPPVQHTGDMLTGKHMVTLKTSKGDIELELNADAAPMTVTNFVELAKQGYYNNLTFHRVIKDFMIQGGDPVGNGTGGESVFGPTFKDEINAASYGLNVKKLADAQADQPLPEELKDKTFQDFYELQGYKYDSTLTSLPMDRGAIAMANRGPNTNGSQFFIIQKEGGTPWLDGRHTVFGKVTKGMDVVDAIAMAPASEQDVPTAPITFTVEVKN